jgi:very-short-patch-repair endonuclease
MVNIIIYFYTTRKVLWICKLSSQPIKNIKALLYIINCTKDEINLIIGQNNILYKQRDFYDKLFKALNEICEIEREVKILNYRVDFLINKHIIVEVDELGHIGRDKKYEQKREKDLTKLGYVIVRYNPDKDDIFEFINNLLVKLVEYQYITA